MLILTRHRGQTVNIGDDITITVLAISDKQVRLGIEAPRHVDVHREEIFNKIQREKNENS